MGETAYLLANLSVAPVWLLMILAPNARLTERLVATPLVPALYAVLYVGLLVATTATGGDGDMGSMAGLRVAFERDGVLLLAWVHYLCFDMVVGMWEVRDAKRLGLSWWAVGPCLLFTLMFGPFGFLGYCALRYARAGDATWGDEAG